jgi:hypothetical protein
LLVSANLILAAATSLFAEVSSWFDSNNALFDLSNLSNSSVFKLRISSNFSTSNISYPTIDINNNMAYR